MTDYQPQHGSPEPVEPTVTLPEVARKRGLQTLWQGLAVVVIMAVATAIGSSLSAESWGEWLGSWQQWTWAAWQAAGTAVVAWLVRRYSDRSGVQTIEETR